MKGSGRKLLKPSPPQVLRQPSLLCGLSRW